MSSLAFPKPEPLASVRRRKRRAHAEATAILRAIVMARAGNRCECGCGRSGPFEMDHVYGGSGRRRQQQSPETCMALAPECHRAKTENRPTAEYWRHVYRSFCHLHGYARNP